MLIRGIICAALSAALSISLLPVQAKRSAAREE